MLVVSGVALSSINVVTYEFFEDVGHCGVIYDFID